MSEIPTTETHHSTTFLDLLRRQMSGHDHTTRKRSLKERLGFNCIGCFGPTWNLRLTNSTTNSQSQSEEEEQESETGSGTGMNLATALEAERFHNNNGRELTVTVTENVDMTPSRVSLMRLLEETAERVVTDVDEGKETESLTVTGNDSVCCVCMGRKKGAAFIPCGHTFCRVCSRELWLNRGSCPLCNRPILEILDIF